MTESARFIVCVPTYDERENLPRMIDALAAVREQAPASGDVLVIDDSSPDGTGELADLRGDRVADVVELRQPALLGQRPDRLRRLAEALRRPAVGEHAVDDRPVELVEVAEQVEEIGDLGVTQGSHRQG